MEMEKCKNMSDWTKLLLRLAIGAIFILAGWGKLQNPAMIQGMLNGMGFPLPEIMGWVLILTELIGGVLVLLGLFTCWASIPMAFAMLVALVMVHLPQVFQAGGDFNKSGASFVALILAVLLHFVATGSGKYSLDTLIANRKK